MQSFIGHLTSRFIIHMVAWEWCIFQVMQEVCSHPSSHSENILHRLEEKRLSDCRLSMIISNQFLQDSWRQGSKAVDGTGDSLEPNSEILSCHDLPMKSMDIDGYDRFKYMACIECIVACACQAKVLRAPRCSVGSGAPTIPCLEPQERLEEFSAATWIWEYWPLVTCEKWQY